MPLRSPGETVHAHTSVVALAAALMLVVLLALPLLAVDDTADDTGILTGLSWTAVSIPLHPGLPMPVLAKNSILLSTLSLPEFLSSHFGEKRFAEGSLTLLSSLVPMLAALYSVPPCFSCCALQGARLARQS